MMAFEFTSEHRYYGDRNVCIKKFKDYAWFIEHEHSTAHIISVHFAWIN